MNYRKRVLKPPVNCINFRRHRQLARLNVFESQVFFIYLFICLFLCFFFYLSLSLFVFFFFFFFFGGGGY